MKPGFKQTEVGAIPEDWELAILGEQFSFSGGYSASRAQLGTNGHCYLHYGDIHTSMRPYVNVSADYADIPKLDIPLARISAKSILRDGDVVFVDASEDDEGTSKHQLVINPDNIPYISGLHTIVAKAKPECRLAKSYRQYCFQSRYIKDQFLFYATGIKVTGISKPNIAKINIVFPPTSAEQEAIAEALGDADALIESLEQLVAKKRDVKQGAMQELLTGKRRLPGFTGKWEMKPLGKIADVIMGQSPTSIYYNTKGIGLPLIQGNADILNRRTIQRIFTTDVTKHGKAGDIVLSVRAPVGEVARAMFDVCLGRGVCAVRYANDFLYHALIAHEPTWSRLSKGSTFDSVTSSDVKAFAINLPATVAEQLAVAQVLSDMDAELAALEAKLAKARVIKQGMMQELLTGRIRLK